MKRTTAVHATFVLERTYPQPLERVFAAFAVSARKRRWFAEGHAEVLDFESDFRVGGPERVRLRYGEDTPIAGAIITGESVHLDIVDEARIVLAGTMAMGEARFSASLVTVEFFPDRDGTLLVLTHQGAFFEGADGPAIREAGWVTLLDRLGAALAR